MHNNRIIIARVWPRYEGRYESRAGVIMGLDVSRFKTICIYLAKCSSSRNFLEENGHKAYYLSSGNLRAFNPLVVWKLAKILKNEAVDIVHCHKHKATVYGTIAATLAHTPVVIAHVHGLGRTRNFQRRLVNRWVMKKVKKILTVGQAVRDDVIQSNPGVLSEKVVSEGNSIDYSRFADVSVTKSQAKERLGLPAASFVFGMVGRLTPAKGLSYLISAFAKVKREIPDAHLLIVGDGRFRNDLQKQAMETTFAESIHFLGYRNDIPQVLKAMDIFVLPSMNEGLPRALLEAMAAGVPCIATNRGGIPEILVNGEFGYLVPCEDENSLADAMTGLATKTDEQLKRMIEKAQQRVKQCYSHEVVIKSLESIYEDATARD